MNSPVEVSICVITYNHSKYIRKCLDSMLRQKTSFRYEIVIRDDVSTDNTQQILEEYERKYPNIIRVLKSKVNLGMNTNFMTVVREARGQFISVCEGDDYFIDNEKLQTQFQYSKKYKDVNFFIHKVNLDINSKVVDSCESSRFFGSDVEARFTIKDIMTFKGQFAGTSSYFIKAEKLKSLPKIYETAPVGDLFAEVIACGNEGGVFIPKAMSCYRVECAGSWSEKVREYTPEQWLEFVKNMKPMTFYLINEYPNHKQYFIQRLDWLNYVSSISYLELGQYGEFKKHITPTSKNYISIVHKVLDSIKFSYLLSNITLRIYRYSRKFR